MIAVPTVPYLLPEKLYVSRVLMVRIGRSHARTGFSAGVFTGALALMKPVDAVRVRVRIS